MSDELYTEIILDYFKNPRNKGEVSDATVSATEHNPLCGDKIRLDLKINPQTNKITEAKFSGEGCAISQATTSMLTEQLIGKTGEEIAKISNEEIFKMLGIQISPGRIKCALLGLITAKKAILQHKHGL
ncbi:SUF system NifU family Fe-S cluster assembly protein [Candidatus Peregrinibacteria bacterium]|nr:SUF system NifU family Fe-S cluster assembly protein [Candidatus Peregrinibacteria bacterium]